MCMEYTTVIVNTIQSSESSFALQEIEELERQLEPLKAQLASYQDLPPVSAQ